MLVGIKIEIKLLFTKCLKLIIFFFCSSFKFILFKNILCSTVFSKLFFEYKNNSSLKIPFENIDFIE